MVTITVLTGRRKDELLRLFLEIYNFPKRTEELGLQVRNGEPSLMSVTGGW